jgi:hypothetical protein
MPVLYLRGPLPHYLIGDELLKAPQIVIADSKLFQLPEIVRSRPDMPARTRENLCDAR